MKFKKAIRNACRRLRQRPVVIRIIAAMRRRKMVKVAGYVAQQWSEGYLFARYIGGTLVWLPRQDCIWHPIIKNARLNLGDMELPRDLAAEKGLL